jgi:hypothetical protein
MLRLVIAVLVLTSLAAPGLPLSVELVVTKKVELRGPLEDLVTFGLLKEMTCDSRGHIFSPSNRKYGDAINAIVRFTDDAASYRTFSIDELKYLEDGTITDFDLEPNGDLYVLARQVLKYSPQTVPVEFGRTFIVHYDQDGTVRSQVQLKMNTDNFRPTGLAVLKNHEYLVVGRQQISEGKTFMTAQIFEANGNLSTKLGLNRDGTKTSNSGAARSTRVFNPIAIKANGFVYVMRGTTNELIYVLSETGSLLKTIQLKPDSLEFDSPQIIGNDLIVDEHSPLSKETDAGVEVRSGPQRRSFPVFSLETGEIILEYYWHEETLGLACYAPGSFTFIGQDLATNPSGWAIFEARPAGPDRRKPPGTGD